MNGTLRVREDDKRSVGTDKKDVDWKSWNTKCMMIITSSD